MAKLTKSFMNWSSGKDCALALWNIKQEDKLSIDALFTTINGEHKRVGLHGLREALLRAQAQAIGLPLKLLSLPEQADMPTYNRLMKGAMDELIDKGFRCSVFGDIFLEDLRAYREEELRKVGLKSAFPLWKKDTTQLITDFVDLGFKSVVVSASSEFFDADFVGTEIDQNFLAKLPEQVDPCGENGEFHTFCYDGPIFTHAVPFEKGEVVSRSYSNPKAEGELTFYFLDLHLRSQSI